MAEAKSERVSRPWFPLAPGEGWPVAMALGWFFLIMFSYQLLRPLRDSLVGQLPENEKSRLFVAVFLVMLVAVPIYSRLVSWLPRRQLVVMLMGFFSLNLLGFAVWNLQGGGVWLVRVFFVWVGFFSLFATSLFWTVMTDLFSEDRGKRLFGPIAGGATAGAIAGSSVALSADSIGTTALLVASASLLLLGLLFMGGLEYATRGWSGSPRAAPITGGIWEGVRGIVRSPYLLLTILYIGLISCCGTTLYMQLTEQAALEIPSLEKRTSYFAGLNLTVQVGTLFVQLLIVGWVMRTWGVSVSLALLPATAAACFAALTYSRELWVLAIADVVSRIVMYGFSVPSREVLFTVVSREAKYKSKNVVDTLVIRGSDALASSLFAQVKNVLTVTGINGLLFPLTLLWGVLAIGLGRQQARLAKEKKQES